MLPKSRKPWYARNMGLRGPAKGVRIGGRAKGTPNKMTSSAKEAIQLAFEGLGGTDALIAWAQDPKNKSVFYANIYTKILPHEVTGSLKIDPLLVGD